MKLFGKSKAAPPAPVAPPEPVEAPAAAASAAPSTSGIDMTKRTGKISMVKGDAPVMIANTGTLTATCAWPPATDYDVYAYVVLTDGKVVPVAAFPAGSDEPKRMKWSGDGKVTHMGDVKRSGAKEAVEVIEIVLGADIAAVVPVVYSAQSNGPGSFRRYQVSASIDNGAGDVVTIDASNASNDDGVYTMVPGVIYNRPGGVVVERLESYSRRGENRPKVSLGKDGSVTVKMDAGPRNSYK